MTGTGALIGGIGALTGDDRLTKIGGGIALAGVLFYALERNQQRRVSQRTDYLRRRYSTGKAKADYSFLAVPSPESSAGKAKVRQAAKNKGISNPVSVVRVNNKTGKASNKATVIERPKQGEVVKISGVGTGEFVS